MPVPHSTNRLLSSLVAVFVCLFFSASSLQAAPLAVTLVLSESSGPYQEFSVALREKLLNKNIALEVIDGPTELIPEYSLVICVGMKAASAVAGSNAYAVLNVLIPKNGYEKLLRDFPQRAASKTFSAIFLDQPVERQIRLIEAFLQGKRHGGTRNIGVLFDSFSPDVLAELRQQMAKHRLNLVERKVGPNLPLPVALQEVLDNSDVLLALPDPSIYNNSTIRNILLSSYRSGDPVIGFSSSYVKAGALAAVFSTPQQIAVQAAQAIQQFGEARTLPAAQHPLLFEVSVNEQVGQSLGLSIKTPDELHQEISAIKGDAP